MEDKTKKWSWLERFLKLVCGGGRRLLYNSKLTHFKIFNFNSLSNKKIRGIVHMFSNIIHLDFRESMKSESIGKVLKLIIKSYSNLNYLNISALYSSFVENDKGLCAIVNSCHKLECLNISKRTEFSKTSICNIIYSCSRL